MRSLRRICGVSLADRIRNEEVHRMAGTSEDVTVRMKKNVLSWFGHVNRMSDERITKKIYDGKVSVKRGRGRPRLTFENTVSKILEENHVKSMRTPRRTFMKRLMTVDVGKELCRDCSVWSDPYSLTTTLGMKREDVCVCVYVCMYVGRIHM